MARPTRVIRSAIETTTRRPSLQVVILVLLMLIAAVGLLTFNDQRTISEPTVVYAWVDSNPKEGRSLLTKPNATCANTQQGLRCTSAQRWKGFSLFMAPKDHFLLQTAEDIYVSPSTWKKVAAFSRSVWREKLSVAETAVLAIVALRSSTVSAAVWDLSQIRR